MELKDMALAHLQNIESALRDLYAQREKMNQEIERLLNYLKEGQALVSSASEQSVVEENIETE